MGENLTLWNKLKQPPKTALKPIKGGRTNGMTDISPQWRYQAITDALGPCGVGWKFTIEKQWLEVGSDGNVAAFVNINLYIKNNSEWSEAIPGTGGSSFIAKEKNGLYTSDECFKMATTDALSTALKMIGVAADIYLGNFINGEYINQPVEYISEEQAANIQALIDETGADLNRFLGFYKISKIEEIPAQNYNNVIGVLEKKRHENS